MEDQKISGYRALTLIETELINGTKATAKFVEAFIDHLATKAELDQRWLAIAKTDLQKGFMFLVRAIAKPEGF